MSMETFLIVFYLFIGLVMASANLGAAHKRGMQTLGKGVTMMVILKHLHVIATIVIAWPLVIAFLFGTGELGQGKDKEKE